MGAPCEGVARPNAGRIGDCAVLRGLRRKRVSGSPARCCWCCCFLHVVFSVFFSQPLCRTQSASAARLSSVEPAAGELFSPFLPAGVFGVSPTTHQHNMHKMFNPSSTSATRPTAQCPTGQVSRSTVQRPPPEASQGPLNLKISRPGSRGCVSVSECRQTMPVAVARWSVSATNATTARIILRECLGHHRISAPHPRLVEIKYHLSLFLIFNSPFPVQMESKVVADRVHSAGPRQELSLKPSPPSFALRSNQDLALCAG